MAPVKMAPRRRTIPTLIVAAPRAGSAALAQALHLAVAQPFALPAKARLIYLYRDPRESIASMIDALRSGALATPAELAGKPLVDIAVAHWERCTRAIVEHLAARPADTWMGTTYQALTTTPETELPRLAEFARVSWDPAYTLTPPSSARWREHQLTILPRLSAIASTNARAKLVCATSMATPMTAEASPRQLHSPRAPD